MAAFSRVLYDALAAQLYPLAGHNHGVVRVRLCLLAAAAMLAVLPLQFAAAQTCGHPSVSVGMGVSYFPYFERDVGERQAGLSAAVRLEPCTAGLGLEAGYSALIRGTSVAGGIDRLDVMRLALRWTGAAESTFRVNQALGVARLAVDAGPQIDCGDFPVCNEYAPHDARLLAGLLGAELEVRLGSRGRIGAGGLAYLALGSWKNDGLPSLVELRIAAGVRW